MRTDLFELICCPACGNRLFLESENGDSGQLNCRECSAQYPIEKGMPRLYVDDEFWVSKAKEALGWVSIHKKLNLYEQTENAVDLQIPYFPEEPWITVACHFDVALGLMKLRGNETILDLGAGRGWAAKQFALKGCHVVAIDIVPDDQVGLGRAQVLMKNANTFFETVIGDNENLPFLPAKFDFVFCCGVLHHSADMSLLMKNIYKVLKPGGKLVAIYEPCISVYDDEMTILKRDAADELEAGINERRPTILDYFKVLRIFTEIHIQPFFGAGAPEEENWNDYIKIILIKPILRLRLRALLDFWRLTRFPFQAERERFISAVLFNLGGALVITAEK